jgi:hypothetical protein
VFKHIVQGAVKHPIVAGALMIIGGVAVVEAVEKWTAKAPSTAQPIKQGT